MNSQYPILLVFDSSYAEYSLVLISSIINNSSNLVFFHLVTDNETDYELQEKFLTDNKVEYMLYRINSSVFDKFPLSGHITKGAYYLLYSLEIIEKGNSKVILYLDIDILVKEDITKVFDLFDSRFSLNCINSSDDDYFGSGFLLINTEKALEKFKLSSFIDALNTNPNITWHDQDLLNIVFKDDSVKNIPYDWDFPIQHYVVDKIKFQEKGQNLLSAKSIHFLGTTKPWRYSTILPFAKEWQTLFFDIYGKKPWIKVTLKEFILKILYIVFPNPKILFQFQSFLQKFKINKKI